MTAATMSGPARPRVPALDRRTAMRLARSEYERIVDAVRRLEADDWHRPTANELWVSR